MRRLACLLTGVLVVLVLGSDSPKEYDDRTIVDPLEGTWRLTEWEYVGVKKTIAGQHYYVRTFRSGTFTDDYDSDGDLWRGRYCTVPTRKPSHLDLLPSTGRCKDETIKYIYQIEGDTLRTATTHSVGRPQGFNDAEAIVSTYKRVK